MFQFIVSPNLPQRACCTKDFDLSHLFYQMCYGTFQTWEFHRPIILLEVLFWHILYKAKWTLKKSQTDYYVKYNFRKLLWISEDSFISTIARLKNGCQAIQGKIGRQAIYLSFHWHHWNHSVNFLTNVIYIIIYQKDGLKYLKTVSNR